MPKFSIIVGFRNRDAERVKNSLNSLAVQTIKDFELIFVDYGSDKAVAAQIKPLVENYSFAKYIYNDTRGMFWSRAHALNSGIRPASGQITILWDIDLMVEPDFLEKIAQIEHNKYFTTHRCYYLPKEADGKNYKTQAIIQKSKHNYVGLATINTQILKKISGFDEFYQVWGAEDDDLYQRLQLAGLKRKIINADEIAVFHQWHSSQAPQLPDMWYLQMVEHLYSLQKTTRAQYGKIYTKETRLALKTFESVDYEQFNKIRLSIENKTLLYNELIKTFIQSSDTFFYIDFKYSQTEFSLKAQKMIFLFNRLMQKNKLNFRLVNAKQEERKTVQQNIYSFLKYFIGVNRNKISDYFLEWQEEGFEMIIIKK